MTPRYGVFYASWSLYLRGAVLRASGPADPVPFELGRARRARISARRRWLAGAGLLPVGDALLAWARSAPPVSRAIAYDQQVPAWWRWLIHALSLAVGGAA
jgi:hypothetical protein